MRTAVLLPFLAVLTSHGVHAAPAINYGAEPDVQQSNFILGNPTVTLTSPKMVLKGRARPFVNLFSPGPSGTLESFKQIPFAKPPVGPLRLKPPVPLDPNADMGTVDVSTVAAGACPQQFKGVRTDIPSVPGFAESALEAILSSPLMDVDVLGGREDCLTINVQRPGGVEEGDNLPVMLWIFGGGFELGSTAQYDGAHVVQTGVELGKPVIFVAMNYRVAGFGFLGGKEILADGSANLGLLDQRLAMEWVADNIRSFGGDPDKVTIWGESAGAISVFDQMLVKGGDHTYKGKPLFRGAIMNSGSAIPADPVDCPKAQAIYDQVVANAGCQGKPDTLNCLREVDFETFLEASNNVPFLLSYSSLALSYLPRPDGTFFIESPESITKDGKFARVPYILGSQQDEGTLFALFTSNISTGEEFSAYLKDLYFTNPAADVDQFIATYPDDPKAGAPFGTGDDNDIYPQFKRIAALLGDATFSLTRRVVLNATTTLAPEVPNWSYQGAFDRGTPILGTFHGSDLLQVFYGVKDNFAASGIMLYFLNFAYNLDPNDGAGGTKPDPGFFGKPPPTLPSWPQWSDGNTLVEFGADSFTYIQDDFRPGPFEFIKSHAEFLHI